MPNQPDIVQPRVRRTGRGGNALAALAEQSTRVLIRVPRVAITASQQATIQPQAIQTQAKPLPSNQSRQESATKPAAPIARDQSHYSTTTELLRGSAAAERTAAAPITAHHAARIDAAHTVASGPHLAAPDWLNDRGNWTNKVTQTRVLLVVGAIAGFALGALTWRGHSSHVPAPHNDSSRISSPARVSPEQSQAAASANYTTGAEFNLPAQISASDTTNSNSKAQPNSVWQWNPKGAGANSPASITESDSSKPEITSTSPRLEAPTTTEAQSNDPSRAAWLQGTIDNVHSNPAPVQR